MTTEERDALETTLRTNLREKSQELQELWNSVNDHWGYEDAIYRFYSQSFKVYSLQKTTIRIVELLQSLVPGRELNPWFSRIVQDGTGKQFTMADNARWLEATQPIVEAFPCSLLPGNGLSLSRGTRRTAQPKRMGRTAELVPTVVKTNADLGKQPENETENATES